MTPEVIPTPHQNTTPSSHSCQTGHFPSIIIILTKVLLLITTSLAAVAHGSVLPGATASVLHVIPDDVVAFNETQNISAGAVDPAVRFTEYEGSACGGWEAQYKAPDGGCYLLPTGDGFKIRKIANTCRGLCFSCSVLRCV